MLKSQFELLVKFIYSTIFGWFYAIWLYDLPALLYRDRVNYISYATYPDIYINIAKAKGYIFFEPLFLLFNKWTLGLFNNPEFSVKIFVFFITFSLCFFCFYRTRYFVFGLLAVFFLFIQTQALGMQLVTIRQGLGMALLLLTLPSTKKEVQVFLLIAFCGLIHNSFYIFLLFYLMDWFLDNKVKVRKSIRLTYLILFGLIFSISFFVASKFLETKQDYQDFEYSSSGGAFLFWLSVLIYFLLFKGENETDRFSKLSYKISIVGLIIYVTGYFFTPISGRIIGTFAPFIIISLFSKFKTSDIFVFIFMVLVNFYLYYNGAFEGFLAVPLETFHSYIF
ncbi:MAG: hypothetical protein K0S24_1519 [Sphingobacterium sp.]|jgi:hypothetical protein|nr:hypothetical protein [Sphingobacterium sp.]